MVDGYTPEGYAYTLVGIKKTIKLIYQDAELEVYMYDFSKPCSLHDGRTEITHDRVYYITRGIKFRPEDEKATLWHGGRLLCPKCFSLLHHMFTGLEMDDP